VQQPVPKPSLGPCPNTTGARVSSGIRFGVPTGIGATATTTTTATSMDLIMAVTTGVAPATTADLTTADLATGTPAPADVTTTGLAPDANSRPST